MKKSKLLRLPTLNPRLRTDITKASHPVFKSIYTCISVFILLLAGSPDAVAQVTINRTSSILAGTSPFQDSLWTFNLNDNYSLIRRLGPTISGGTITGINSVATHPITGEHYAVLKLSGVSGRVLAKMNVQTGVCTNIGNLGDNFSSITFNSNGTLFGVTGDGATVSETVYTINTSTAAKTFYKTLGNGADGELIVFNPDDNNIYHWSGNGAVVWEKFDTSGGAVQGLTYSGTTGGESFGGIYLGSDQMLVSNISSSFRIWNTSTGVIGGIVANTPDDIRGLGRENCTSSVSAPSTVICPSGNVTLTVTNGTGDYQWYKDGSLIASANSATYAASSAGVYNCRYTDQCGIYDSTASGITLTTGTSVTPSVSVGTSPSTTICPGTNVTFTATPTNGGATPSYAWSVNGSPAGTNSATYSNAALTNGATISVTMTTSAICPTSATATSSTVTMTVSPTVTPSVSIAATPSASVCGNSSVSFTATPTDGGASPTYQWKKNGGNIATGVSWNAGTSLVTGDAITVEMTSNAACPSPSATAVSNTVTMTVTPTVTPSVTIASSAGTNICPSTSVTFTATPTNGGASPTYQWKRNGNNVATGVTWNAGTSLANGDVITVEMTSNAACPSPTATVTSNQLTMVVTGSVTPSVTASSNIGTSICPGATAIFTATPTNGGTTPTYQWRKNTINVGTGTTYTTAPAPGDVIDVVMTTSASCATSPTATSSPLTITSSAVTPGVTLTKTPNTAICPGTAVVFSAIHSNGGPNPSYQWKVNGNNVGTNSASWGSSSLNNNDVVSVTMTSSICTAPTTATANTTITVNNITPASVSIAANPGNTICSGTGVTFTATPTGGGTPTYQWKRNGVNVGTNSATYNAGTTLTNGNTIQCVMTSSATCATPKISNSNIISMNVTTTVTPSVSISTIPTGTACVGGVLTFVANPQNGGATPSYQWKIDGNNVGTNFASYTDNGTLATGAHTISVTMTSSVSQCITTTTATGTLNKSISPLVTPTVSISSTQAPQGDACVGSSVTFTPSTTNAGSTPTYQWKKNGVNVATGSSYAAGATLVTGDVITVEMTSSASCASPVVVNSAPQPITVWPNVTATATISSNPGNTVGCTGLPVTFTAAVANVGSNPTFQWKKNGVNVGTNSPTYVDAGLTTGNTVSCQVTTSIPCSTPKPVTSNTLTMTMNGNVTASINLAVTPDSVGCENTPFTFNTFHTDGGTNPAFKWYKNGTPIPGAAQAVYSSNNLVDGDVISCELISSGVCTAPVMSAGMSVEVIPSPIPTLTIAGVPDDQGINFVATLTNGGQNPTFQWRKNGHDIPGATGPTYKGFGLNASDKINVFAHSDIECANPEFLLSNTLDVQKVTAITTVTTAFDELTLFPNPNGGRFTVKGTTKISTNSKASVEVLNAVGQVVFKNTAELKGNELEVNVEMGGHNAAGMYMLRVTVDSHTDNIRFVVKD